MHALLARVHLGLGGGDRIDSLGHPSKLHSRRCRSLHELGEIEAAETPLGQRNPIELGLQLLESVGLDVERGQEGGE